MELSIFIKEAIRHSHESRRTVQVNVSSREEVEAAIRHLEATRPNVGHIGAGIGTEVWGCDGDTTWPDESWRILLVVARPLD